MRFFNIPVFLLIFFLFFSISSFAVDCDDAFLFPGSKLYYADKVIRSGIIEESRRLFPSFVDPIKERALVNEWNIEAPAPSLLKTLLPKDVYFLKYQQHQPGSQTAIKLHEPGDALIARAGYNAEGREFHTNVVFSTRALQSNMKTGKNWLAGEDAKAVYLFLHGGGTKSTGAHVGSGLVTHLRKYKVDVISVDLPWHGLGHREILDFESELRILGAFAQKYIPPTVPLVVGGHSWGAVFADELMMMTDRPREKFFFHENLKAVFLFSTAVDAAPGKSMQEKEAAFSKIIADVNHNRQDEAPEAEKDLYKKIVLAGKTSPLGNWYASGTMFQADQSPPAHGGREYIPAYVAVGDWDSLVRIGFRELYDARYGGLKNVKVFKVLDRLRSRDSENANDPLEKVGHMLSDVRSEDGKEDNLQYALTKDWIRLELRESAAKELKILITEQVQSSSLDRWTKNRILKKLEELSSLEKINWFIYTDSFVKQLEPSSLDFIKKSIIEKAESSTLTGAISVSSSIRELIRQQLELSSLDEKAKKNIAGRVDKITSIEKMRDFVHRPGDPNIRQFIGEWDPAFLAAVDTFIEGRFVEHKRASTDSPFIRTVQNFANDMAFREYQKDYTYYAHKGYMKQISIRNADILEKIAAIVKSYYSPGMRVINALTRVRELEREALERLDAVKKELIHITSPDNLRRIPHPGAQRALVKLKNQMESDHQVEDMATTADDIMNLRTQNGNLLFTDTQTGHVKRTKEFTKSVREGKDDAVIELMEKMGLSDADHGSLTLLLREFSFNRELEKGYFTLRQEDLKVEGIDPVKGERIDNYYEKLMSVNTEWKSLENQRTSYGQMLGVLKDKHEELLQRVKKDVKTIRDALDKTVALLPPDSLRGKFQRLEENAEKMMLAKESLDKVLDEKAAQIFQNRELDSLEITRILQEQRSVIDDFLFLYEQHVQNRTEYNRRAIVAMEQGELESRREVEERSLKEAVISLYGKEAGGEAPRLSQADKNAIQEKLEKEQESREMSELEQRKFVIAEIEKISGYLALDHIIAYLAKVESEQVDIERQSVRNRIEYVDTVRHLTYLIPENTNPEVHALLQQALLAVNPQEIPIKDIMFYSGSDKAQALQHIHNHNSILNAFIKQWSNLRSAFLPFLPTVYE